MNVNYSKGSMIIGVDEVGRGPIAGPTAVGAFVFLNENAKRIFRGVKESKQLTEKKREKWFAIIVKARKGRHVDFSVSFQSEKIVDAKGISHAIGKALMNSLNSLRSRIGAKTSNIRVLLDGGLKAPSDYKDQKTIVKGDEKEMTIALASICAKVARDRYMRKLSREYPLYGFEFNKGYGTEKHYEAIKKYGVCSQHRLTFL